MKETWKAVKGYEGIYEVSNTGKVRSIDRVTNYSNGKSVKTKGKELFFTISKIDERKHQPRASVQLWKENKAKLVPVHRLVALAFIPNPEDKPTVNHIDGNALNNHVDNLEWATYSENQRHAYDTGLIIARTGSTPPNAKRMKAIHTVTGDEIVADSGHQMAELIGSCQQYVNEVAKANSEFKPRTCKGYAIWYL